MTFENALPPVLGRGACFGTSTWYSRFEGRTGRVTEGSRTQGADGETRGNGEGRAGRFEGNGWARV